MVTCTFWNAGIPFNEYRDILENYALTGIHLGPRVSVLVGKADNANH